MSAEHSSPDPREAACRLHISKVLYLRALEARKTRQDDIKDLLGATRPDLSPEAAACVAETVPALLPELHRKWIGMFVETLFATAGMEQIVVLCDGSEDNNAALALAYVMFLESERMEKQMAADLEHVESLGGAGVAEVAATLCARLDGLEAEVLKEREEKARLYAANKSRTVH